MSNNFIYKVIYSSPKRGYNRTIEVHQLIDNVPLFIGFDDKITTASYVGDFGIACKIIADHLDDFEMHDSYRLKQTVKLYQI